ncbi:hypothetical protein K3552_13780 [Leisingera aquaemixtae]|uniref:hypothetical protein n=1 Tax=Leisingera aquaemixtae TaxID=1396826 RepID=UPI0021A6A7D8|nr:hypothetical protein [Leisingera aquaemixtae]UWQ36565.1 hypothetical protein K3552_13780 [Leisingera aquaemixtae]
MSENLARRVLGTATYTATRSSVDGLATLRAVGVLPCANYEAQLEKRPERILPPFWEMAFYVQDVCLRALKPFDISVVVNGSGGAAQITVYDAAGEHHVAVEAAPETTATEDPFTTAGERDQFIVYGRLPAPVSGHQGCIVVPADFLVAAIYYRAFGPASRVECDDFALQNCSPFSSGTGFPFPLAED